MTGWTVIVPIKPPAERKSRLANHLSDEARVALTELMLTNVLGSLNQAKAVGEVVVLSSERYPNLTCGWIRDHGRGLNAELGTLAGLIPYRLAIIHADLPGLTGEDVDRLLAAANASIALAPDRHRRGTNALAALNADTLPVAFGPGSFVRHRRLAPEHVVVDRPGLALDIDTADDIALAVALGHLSRDRWFREAAD